MSTNYYLHRAYEDLHIGLSAFGWAFSLRVYPEQNINKLADWQREFAKGTIYDEYAREVPTNQMMSIITDRQMFTLVGKCLRRARSSKDRPCVSDPAVQYDLCNYEFS